MERTYTYIECGNDMYEALDRAQKIAGIDNTSLWLLNIKGPIDCIECKTENRAELFNDLYKIANNSKYKASCADMGNNEFMFYYIDQS